MKEESQSFSEEELENISGLGEVLRKIRARLIREVYKTPEALDKALKEKMKEVKKK